VKSVILMNKEKNTNLFYRHEDSPGQVEL